MDESAFWSLIEQTVRTDADGGLQLDALTARLEQHAPDQVADFAAHFWHAHAISYGWGLWGAIYLIRGGCGDDSFDYWRAWLIGQGRAVFAAALENPDSLSTLARADGEAEGLMSVADEVYESLTGGQDLPHRGTATPELGEEWDFDEEDEMRARYPNLFEKYG